MPSSSRTDGIFPFGADDAGTSWLKIKTGIDGAIRRPLIQNGTYLFRIACQTLARLELRAKRDWTGLAAWVVSENPPAKLPAI
jgi:hypothetical protein